MGGEIVHFYGTKVKTPWCIFVTGAPPTCICKSQWCEVAAWRTWKPGAQV